MVEKRDISEKTEAAKKKKKEDLEIEEALKHIIQAARIVVEATKQRRPLIKGFRQSLSPVLLPQNHRFQQIQQKPIHSLSAISSARFLEVQTYREFNRVFLLPSVNLSSS